MSLKELIIDWLTASRYVKWLEMRHIEQRQDYTERLAEKDSRIKQLETEIAGLKLECNKMRSVLMPYASTAGAEFVQKYESTSKPPVVPAFSGPDDWAAELNRIYQQEETNVQGERREGIHKPAADDGAQSES